MIYLTIVKKDGKELFKIEKPEDGFIRNWYPKAFGYLTNPETQVSVKATLVSIAHDPKKNRIVATWEAVND